MIPDVLFASLRNAAYAVSVAWFTALLVTVSPFIRPRSNPASVSHGLCFIAHATSFLPPVSLLFATHWLHATAWVAAAAVCVRFHPVRVDLLLFVAFSTATVLADPTLSVLFRYCFLVFIVLFLCNVATRRPQPEPQLDQYDVSVPPDLTSASAFSCLSFDWMTRTVSTGRVRPLEPDDVADLRQTLTSQYVGPHVFQPVWRTQLHSSNPALWVALARTFGPQLLVGSAIKVCNDACVFVSPILLRQIILHLQEKGNGQTDAVFPGVVLACLLLVTYVGQSILFNQYFNINTIVQVRIRAALISAIFAKSCRLSPESRGSFTSGQIQNLMATDSRVVSELVLYINMLWSGLFQICVALFLLVRLLGYVPTATGVFVIVASVPVQGFIIAEIKLARERAASWTDDRVKVTSEAIQGIKLVKLYAWEKSFAQRILGKRTGELALIRRATLIQAWNDCLVSSLPTALSLVTFVTFAMLGNRLDAAVVFPAIALFNVIRPPLLIFPNTVVNVARAAASLDRLQRFLRADELQALGESCHAVDEVLFDSLDADIIARDAAFEWDPSTAQRNSTSPTLSSVTFHVKTGSLVCIVGPTGSGKSSILAGVLGELPITNGCAGMRPKRSIAFSDQVPFVLNGSVRENILFGHAWDEERYRRVIRACSLAADLEILPDGDKTEIGSRGVNLSGGQRARVSLARAVYAKSDICLLDDPLCAVDAHVGRAIFEDCIVREMGATTRLMTTNQIHFAASPYVDAVVVVENGVVVEAGPREELLADTSSAFSRLVEANGGHESASDMHAHDHQEAIAEPPITVANHVIIEVSAEPIRRPPQLHSGREQIDIGTAAIPVAQVATSELRGVEEGVPLLTNDDAFSYGTTERGRLTKKEQKKHGRIAGDHYKAYAVAAGGWGCTFLIGFLAIGAQVCAIAVNFWLSLWSEGSQAHKLTLSQMDMKNFTNFHLLIYVVLGVVSVLITFGRAFMVAFGSIRASVYLHEKLLLSVLGAPSSFFNSTPQGRIVNRFNSDIDKIDSQLASTLQSVLRSFLHLLCTFILIVWATPAFLVFAIPAGAICLYVQEFYRRSSVDLRRLEALARSPLYSHFDETLDGVVTIRAFGDSVARATAINHRHTDALNRTTFASVSANRWLAVRLEAVASILIFIATILAIAAPPDKLSASMTGLVLSYTMQIMGAMTWTVRQFTETESQMSAVERVAEYSTSPPFPQEEEGGLEKSWASRKHGRGQVFSRVDSRGLVSDKSAELLSQTSRRLQRWPRRGKIEFVNVTMRYRHDLEPALRSVSFSIAPGEHVGIVGRTGAGKSSTVQSLFRLYEAETGKILIDGVDISKMDLCDLRSSLSVIPQEPLCFSGTIRSNLDMFGDRSDASVLRALQSCGLQDTMKDRIDLDYEVLEGGMNLSVGQRQLLCLGRALLRDSQVLVLDEATSSVSNETDACIQRTLREEMGHCTVLTVAHRLHTVMDSDRIIVMEAGRVSEIGEPRDLLSRRSLLSSLVDETGPSTAASLRQAAGVPPKFWAKAKRTVA